MLDWNVIIMHLGYSRSLQDYMPLVMRFLVHMKPHFEQIDGQKIIFHGMPKVKDRDGAGKYVMEERI